MLENLAIFLIGIAGGFVGGAAAGVGLITIPVLLLLGIPPHIAIASNKFGAFGVTIGTTIKFFQEKIYVKELILPMTIISIAGQALGAQLLLEVNEAILSKIIGVLLLVVLPTLFLRKDVGLVQQTLTPKRRWVAYVLNFLSQTWGGFFSPGSGFFHTLVSVRAYGLTLLQAKGTSRIPHLFGTVAVIAIFARGGIIDYWIGGILLVSMFIGSYIGAHVAIKKGDRWIKPVMAAIIVVASLRLLFS